MYENDKHILNLYIYIMKIVESQRHEECFNYSRSDQPLAELITVPAGDKGDLPIRTNEIVFFLEGGLHFIFSDFLEHKGTKGQMLLLPAGGRYYYEAFEKTVILVFRITKPIQVCEKLSIAKFYKHYFGKQQNSSEQYEPYYSTLAMNQRIWYFVEGVVNCLNDGIRCRNYFNTVIKEFILMLSVYYSEDDICRFFCRITINEDTTFAEHVRRQWHIYKNVKEIAESMWMTPRKFSAKFKEVFGQTPYSWMKGKRAKLIEKELTTTDKQIKQIAFEQGFDNKSQFTKFCTKELGANPSEIRTRKSDQTA